MKFLVVLSALAASALAEPGVVSPLAYSYGLPYAYGLPYHHGLLAAAAVRSSVVVPTHTVVAAPAVVRTQYHAQDELGQASYGHTEPFQAHAAFQDAAGNKVGSYSYVAPTGEVVRADYVADALGYRVASNALPVGPAAAPAPVAETAEVVAARAAHLAEVEAAKSRSKRQVALTYAAPAVAYAAPALTYAAPAVAYAAPAVRTATLTRVVNNPGHAVSYRVD